jgi:hypothetical protein
MTNDLGTDFFTAYMDYADIDNSEAPATYHRWVCASILGALLGRSIHFQLGPHTIYPNQYVMLMGSPGARKGSAMGIGKGLLKALGYSRFAADKTSKERFLMDMKSTDLVAGFDDLESIELDAASESYICAGEFTDFIGQNNMEFVTMLTNLWDNLPEYTQPKITGKSVQIMKPTVNLLGGNTVQGFALAFPPEALGNGFLSRVLMIHAEPSGVKIPWPGELDHNKKTALVKRLKIVKELGGVFGVTKAAKELGTEIYSKEIPVDDPRFNYYAQRRYIHLLKLSLIMAAAELATEIDVPHMIRANTMLAMAEKHMPRALGEYGKNKHAVVSGAIIEFLMSRKLPASSTDIWKIVHKDVSKVTELAEILSSLKAADKIQVLTIKGKSGYMPKLKPANEWPPHLLDTSWITEKELFN